MKIGIVGTGNISLKHLHEFNKIDKVKIEAVCDTDHSNLTKFLSHDKSIRGYSSFCLLYTSPSPRDNR